MNRLLWGNTQKTQSIGSWLSELKLYARTPDVAINKIECELIHKSKTKPYRLARRLGVLLGVIYSDLDGDEFLLDCVIKAFTNLEARHAK